MNSQTTKSHGLTTNLTAHEGPEGRLLLAQLIADPSDRQAAPSQAVVVIDRSGSMRGPKLDQAKLAVARLVRSLNKEDQIGVVSYDQSVSLVAALGAPSETVARQVEKIESGGNTNLYDGWLTGAKLAGAGGRVILLSDGLANAGRYHDAHSLSMHASRTYEKFRVTTTTIGIGEDYDEALMAGMARQGGGSHYFASSAEAIMEAFSQERFSMGAVSLLQVSLRYAGATYQLGHMWGDEVKRLVIHADSLSHPAATLRYTPAATDQPMIVTLTMPQAFGHSDEATLELLLKSASDAEIAAGSVQDPQSAREAREQVRAVVLKLMAHPQADTDLVGAVRSGLEATMARLEALEKNYDVSAASVHRKRSHQAGYNLAEPARAYSSIAEDKSLAYALAGAAQSMPAPAMAMAEDDAFGLLPAEKWLSFPALPVGMAGEAVRVVLANPRDGFLVAEIEKATGRRVLPERNGMAEEEIRRALQAH